MLGDSDEEHPTITPAITPNQRERRRTGLHPHAFGTNGIENLRAKFDLDRLDARPEALLDGLINVATRFADGDSDGRIFFG